MYNIDFLEKECRFDINKDNKLLEWEKETLKAINENEYNNICLICDRKQGTTTFAKMLHYFRQICDCYLIMPSVEAASMINRRLHFCIPGFKQCKCNSFQIPVSPKTFEKELNKRKQKWEKVHKPIEEFLEQQIPYEFEVMWECSSFKFDFDTYKLIKSLNPSFFTMIIKDDHNLYTKNEEIQELIKDSLVVDIRDLGNWLEAK